MVTQAGGSTAPTPAITGDEADLKLRIAILHPDLGIGGAERLVVDAALGLQGRGHTVEILTSHHDPNHSFEETNDGSLRVTHVPSFVPRSLFGAFHIYLAIFRQLHLVLVLLFSIYVSKTRRQYDVYVLDQLSACGPILRWVTGRRMVFYCHFPDKLLAAGKEAIVDDIEGTKKQVGLLKSLYRGPADWIEEYSTGLSDVILANSKFTANVFKTSFPSIDRNPEVVYPGINIDAYEGPLPDTDSPDVAAIKSDRPTFVSLNRFERKKNVALAIETFAAVKPLLEAREGRVAGAPRLVIGGGYDPRVHDNVSTLLFLVETCSKLNLAFEFVANDPNLEGSLPTQSLPEAAPPVTFVLNFTTAQRQYLLRSPQTICLLYTPGNEHFGIGPVEGMICGLPILACQSGGPTESLVDFSVRSQEISPGKPSGRPRSIQGTAWLRPPSSEEWANALMEIVNLPTAEREALAVRAKDRARQRFGMKQMCVGFELALYRAVAMGQVRDFPLDWSDAQFGLLGIVLAIWVMSLEKFSWVALAKPFKFAVLMTIFVVMFRFFMLKMRGA